METGIADAEKLFQRYESALLQLGKMVFLGQAKLDLLSILNGESRVILRQTFVEPRRYFRFAKSGIDYEMHVLMKDCAVHFLIIALGRNDDPILVLAGLEVPRYPIFDLSVGPQRLERFECR